MTTDADLVEGVRAGDASAVGALYVRYRGRARAVALSVECDPDVVDDLVSEAFTRVFESVRDGGGPVLGFGPYLATVIRHLSVDRFRRERRLVHVSDVEHLDSVLAPIEVDSDGMVLDGVSDSMSPIGAVMAVFERDTVIEALDRLDASARMVVVHVVVNGGSTREVAMSCGVSTQSMSARAYRARERLRQEYLSAHLATETGGQCRTCVEDLGAFVRGALRKRRQQAIEDHLVTCAECRRREDELRDLNRSMPGTVGRG